MPNILNEPNTFKGGDDIWFSEKIHGCLEKNTKILLSDGTTKTIREIVENKLKVCVYGVDENGNIVSTPVKNWYINGKSEDWLKISYKRRGFGTVGNFFREKVQHLRISAFFCNFCIRKVRVLCCASTKCAPLFFERKLL